MMTILNLAATPPTPKQVKAGVVDLPQKAENLLTYRPVSSDDIADRAERLAEMVIQNGIGGDEEDDPIPSHVLLGNGIPAFMLSALEKALRRRGITPLYSLPEKEGLPWVGFIEPPIG